MKSNINFHIHTVFSDGGKTVKEVVDGLIAEGVQYFAITDHDAIEGNIEAHELAEKHGLKHVNGVELSCCYDGEGGMDTTCVCHIVGLGFEYGKMEEKLKELTDKKYALLDELFNALVADGYNLDRENVVADSGKIEERKRIANELIGKGYAIDADAAFAEILNSDKYVKYAKNLPTVKEGVGIIHDCGGIAVWAHPFGYTRGGKKELAYKKIVLIAEKMAEYGMDALEAYYQKYDKRRIEFLVSLGDKYRWCRSVGTDYHGTQISMAKYPEYAAKLRPQRLSFDVEDINPDCTETACLVSALTAYGSANDREIKFDLESRKGTNYRAGGNIKIINGKLKFFCYFVDSSCDMELYYYFSRAQTAMILEYVGCKLTDSDEEMERAFKSKFVTDYDVSSYLRRYNINPDMSSWCHYDDD